MKFGSSVVLLGLVLDRQPAEGDEVGNARIAHAGLVAGAVDVDEIAGEDAVGGPKPLQWVSPSTVQ